MDIFMIYNLTKKDEDEDEEEEEAEAEENFKSEDRREMYRNDKRYRRDRKRKRKWSLAAWIIWGTLSLLFGVFAVWLSWSSNSVAGYNIALKILFAIFAFLFGFFYIISHIMFKLDLLNALKIAQLKQQIQASSKGAVGGRRL